MGAQGSGRATVKTRAFDLADFSADVLRHLDRHLAGDPERALTHETVERWKLEFERLQKLLRGAIERES